MANSPEKVFVFPCMGCTMLAADTEEQSGSVEYIRADIHEARIAELSSALDYFLLRDPDKSNSWEYTRDRAEELARAVLKEKEGQ